MSHRRSSCAITRSLWLLGLCFVLPRAFGATEVYIDGNFRVRARLYDNLFLQRDVDLTDSNDSTSAGSDGTSTYFQQRFRLEPELRVNQYLSVFSQIDFLPDLTWGTNPEQLVDLDGYAEPLGSSQSFLLPEDVPIISPNRLWAEVYTPFGRFKLGRAAMHVGAGLYFNDGNAWETYHRGDTADRAQFLTKLGHIYFLLGYDIIFEGDYDRPYDAQAAAAAIAYRSELLSGSFYTYYQDDRSWLEEGEINADESLRNNMKTWTFDLWGRTLVGPIELEIEAIYQYGGGAGSRLVFESADANVDPRIREGMTRSAFGGMARAKWNSRQWLFGLEAGLATGDKDPAHSDDDGKLNQFEFDRNYTLGLLLFRIPLPSRASRASDADVWDIYDTAIVGDRISNVFYLAPSVQLNIVENLHARVLGIGGWAMEADAFGGASKYGYEVDLEISSQVFDKLTLSARAAMFLPGNIFGESNEAAFAGELMAVVEF